jgi:hypothetical protein
MEFEVVFYETVNGQAIPARDLDTAEKRMRDWKERNDL